MPLSGALSPGSRLIRNLRDLQLDDELDWPDIQICTFDAKDSAHNQAQRIRKAEWIIFHLLRLWDCDASARKELSNLFPAYEPRQSLELRSALFVQLSQLKKDGVFPKDLILRKTMFDDCKGPKFEELLLSLSTSVLAKVLDRHTKDKSAVKEFLLNDGTPDATNVQIIDTAYRISLQNTLTSRANLRRRWQRFGRVLKLKEEEIAQRSAAHERKVQASQQSRIPRRRLERLQTHVDRDWTTSNEWKAILFGGDQHLPQRTLLQRPYDEVWQLASEEKLYKIQPAGNKSALQKFEQHIDRQNTRLSKWREVKASLDRESGQATQGQQRAEIRKMPRLKTASPELGTTPYEHQQAENASNRGAVADPEPESHATKVTQSPRPLAARMLEQEGSPKSPHLGQEDVLSPKSRPTSMLIQPSPTLDSPSRPAIQRTRSQTIVYSPQVSARESLDSQSSTDTFGIEDASFDVDVDTASIIKSVLEAEPSPSKPPPVPKMQSLSLTERARLSMAPAHYSPTRRADSFDSASPASKQDNDLPSPIRQIGPGTGSLDDRARAAMVAAMSTLPSISSQPTTSQSRPTTARRTTVTNRTSRSPEKRVRKAETPDLSFVDESLLAENVDEDTIFMSRPKIAYSPVIGPVHDKDDLDSVEDFS